MLCELMWYIAINTVHCWVAFDLHIFFYSIHIVCVVFVRMKKNNQQIKTNFDVEETHTDRRRKKEAYATKVISSSHNSKLVRRSVQSTLLKVIFIKVHNTQRPASSFWVSENPFELHYITKHTFVLFKQTIKCNRLTFPQINNRKNDLWRLFFGLTFKLGKYKKNRISVKLLPEGKKKTEKTHTQRRKVKVLRVIVTRRIWHCGCIVCIFHYVWLISWVQFIIVIIISHLFAWCVHY